MPPGPALDGIVGPDEAFPRDETAPTDVERIRDERETKLPDGRLAVLRPPTVTMTPDYAADLAAVRDHLGGRIGLMELTTRLEALERQTLQTEPDSIYSVVEGRS